jgi:hypothetical protein
MIGVPPFAWISRVISLLGPIPYFEKAWWLDVMPEYNPFKYNSFPANAALQSWRTDVQAQILRLGEAGRLKGPSAKSPAPSARLSICLVAPK